LAASFASKSRTKFSCQFVRDSKAQIRDLSAVTKPLNRGKVLKPLEPKSAISVPRDIEARVFEDLCFVARANAEVTQKLKTRSGKS
jgi:hypothetical protein